MTTLTAPSFSQIKAQVAAIRQKVPLARVIGIRCDGRWSGDADQRDGDLRLKIEQCNSPLALRIAIRQPSDEGTIKVLLTNLDQQDLSEDIRLRLAKRRLFQIDSWQIVRTLFAAQAVDPRLSSHNWIAEMLLEAIPAGGFPAARGGFLDAETVWPLLLKQSLGLTSDSPDLTSILNWSLGAENCDHFRRCNESIRQGATDWLIERAGPVAEIVLHTIHESDKPDAVPIGLAAGVVFNDLARGRLEKAIGRMEERFLCGLRPTAGQMQRWTVAATEVVRALRQSDSRSYRQILQRTDDILSEVQADAFCYLSDTSFIGFDQRLARVGNCLSEILTSDSKSVSEELLKAHQAVRCHDQANREVRRLERIEMSLRLIRWLGEIKNQPQVEHRSFADAAQDQLREGGFVDWARLSLRSGDPVREVSEAYARLYATVTEVCEQKNRVFAKLLTDWTAAGSQGDEVIPVERILEQIVAPLAVDSLMLVILIDGMSVAVCLELMTDIARHDWMAIVEPGRKFNRPGLATIPSVTEFSRTSFWTGHLRQGVAADEKATFAEHAKLVSLSRSTSPPVLFHKAGLQQSEDSVLAAEVRKEIASTHRKVVGVVVNAVDDHLLKGEQIDTRWTRDEIKVLPALLHEARIARRLVVLVSDHGHVLDCHAEGRSVKNDQTNGERWRFAENSPAADELLVSGSRVLTQGKRLIAPWSERVRYGMKKNGYHGGLTPQEMIVPIVVLSSTETLPPGWSEQPIDTPDWWDASSRTVVAPPQPVPELKVAKSPAPNLLFALDGEQDTAANSPGKSTPAWVVRLLASSVFIAQKRLGGRNPPPDDLMGKLLSALDERGGKMTHVALARALQYPPLRVPGLLAKAESLLNVDGYDILRRDDASETIVLNRDLLLKQFDLA